MVDFESLGETLSKGDVHTHVECKAYLFFNIECHLPKEAETILFFYITKTKIWIKNSPLKKLKN